MRFAATIPEVTCIATTPFSSFINVVQASPYENICVYTVVLTGLNEKSDNSFPSSSKTC